MNESPGYNPVNCNPHHELLTAVKHALVECSSGERPQLFETRERLQELSGRIESGPWAVLTTLTGSLEMMLGHLLRRGSLETPELMLIATEVMGFIDKALTLPAPNGGASGQSVPTPARLALDSTAFTGNLKLTRPRERQSLGEQDGDSAAGDQKSQVQQNSNGAQPTGGDGDGSRDQRNPKRSPADFGSVAYQMVNESRLGELLIKMGKLEPAQLDRALVIQKLSRKRLGDVLMAMDAVDMRALQAALEVQRQETLRFTDERGSNRSEPYGEAS